MGLEGTKKTENIENVLSEENLTPIELGSGIKDIFSVVPLKLLKYNV